MTSRQRVLTTLNHKTADKIPMDFGGTGVTGIHIKIVAALRDYYGLEKRPVKAFEPYQMLGLVEDDLAEAMGIDVVGLHGRKTLFGFANENWREFRMPWGQVVLVPENFKTTVDEKGDLLIYPEGDTGVPPSGRMPYDGYFFDTIIRQNHFNENNLNPEDNLEEFGLVSEDDLQYYRAETERLAQTGKAVIAGFGGIGFGDIALVPAPFLKDPRGIRDIMEWYISTAIRQDYIHKIFDKQCEIGLENLQRIHAVVGDDIDVLFVCGTDFGTQTSGFCSTDTFNSLYALYYKRINNWVHENTKWKTFKHSCGAVEMFMPYFIESGFDIINPVQCSAAGMEPEKLKYRYGDKLVFWGGGIDTQKTLPFGMPEEIREEVFRRCEVFSKDGGFVFNAVHNIQANTPIKNVVAMLNALKEFNGEK
ncbi:MAG TPA: methyltransferase [Bacteroidetes bacterium]|nr:methyltransferase [Bacteroidota bacterium]